jgi:hypothetical protein
MGPFTKSKQLDLYFVIENDWEPTLVSIAKTESISTLKKAIHNLRKAMFRDIDCTDLTLFKVRNVFGSGIDHVIRV